MIKRVKDRKGQESGFQGMGDHLAIRLSTIENGDEWSSPKIAAPNGRKLIGENLGSDFSWF